MLPTSEPPEKRGLRRRADKLRAIGWINLLVCVAAGLFLDFGDRAWHWTAAATWALLFLAACYARAGQLDRDGPVRRRQSP